MPRQQKLSEEIIWIDVCLLVLLVLGYQQHVLNIRLFVTLTRWYNLNLNLSGSNKKIIKPNNFLLSACRGWRESLLWWGKSSVILQAVYLFHFINNGIHFILSKCLRMLSQYAFVIQFHSYGYLENIKNNAMRCFYCNILELMRLISVFRFRRQFSLRNGISD